MESEQKNGNFQNMQNMGMTTKVKFLFGKNPMII